MCGIVGVVSHNPVNQLLYDGLLLLQHRGQDAAGIATDHSSMFSMHKGNGLVRDVFRTRNMRRCRATRASATAATRPPARRATEEAQPFYVNSPFGITLAHNGNLTNQAQLQGRDVPQDRRHINTNSDSEVLLNVLAHELQEARRRLHARRRARSSRRSPACTGACAAPTRWWRMIAGYGLLAFRDPFGIRPLCLGVNETDRRHRIHGGLANRWRSKAWASASCATSRRARRSSSTSDGNLSRAASAPRTRRSTRASSSTSIWRAPTR